MGLSIDGKNIEQNIHFNWNCLDNFIKWCSTKNIPLLFPDWDGTNANKIIDLRNKKSQRKLKKKLYVVEKFITNEIDYNLFILIKYYIFLKNQLDNNGFIEYS